MSGKGAQHGKMLPAIRNARALVRESTGTSVISEEERVILVLCGANVVPYSWVAPRPHAARRRWLMLFVRFRFFERVFLRSSLVYFHLKGLAIWL